MHSGQEQAPYKKFRALRPEKAAQIEDFVDFLRHGETERRLVEAAMKLSEGSLRAVWDNPEDADYDDL